MSGQISSRDARLDLGRSVAAFLVIYVHYSVNFLAQVDLYQTSEWFVANGLNATGRIAVPIFIMMSGALVIGNCTLSWSHFMRKRALAVLKPYLFGSLLYFAWQAHRGSSEPSLYEFARSFLSGSAYLHLYFLFVLLALYIITPLLQGISHVSDRTLAATIGLLFFLVALERHLAPLGLSLGYLTLGSSLSFLPYFLSGYFLYRRRNYFESFAAVGFVISTAATFCLTWVFTTHPVGPYTGENFNQYSSLNVMLQCVFAMSLLLKLRISAGPLLNTVSWVSDKSLGIYIIHLLVLAEIANGIASYHSVPLMWQLLAYPALSFALSCAIVWVLRCIPGVKGFV